MSFMIESILNSDSYNQTFGSMSMNDKKMFIEPIAIKIEERIKIFMEQPLDDWSGKHCSPSNNQLSSETKKKWSPFLDRDIRN